MTGFTRGELHEIAVDTGYGFWSFIHAIERCGWTSPSGALPYFPPNGHTAAELVRWTHMHDLEAGARLLTVAREFAPVAEARLEKVLIGAML